MRSRKQLVDLHCHASLLPHHPRRTGPLRRRLGSAGRRACRFAVGRGCRTGGGTTARRTTPTRCEPRLAVLCVFDDADSLMGIAPWYLDCSAMHGRVLRPLGSGEVCSDYLGVLCHPAAEEAVVETPGRLPRRERLRATSPTRCVGTCWNSTASTPRTARWPRWPTAWPARAARSIAGRA